MLWRLIGAGGAGWVAAGALNIAGIITPNAPANVIILIAGAVLIGAAWSRP